MLVSGVSFGLLHALNAIATGDVFAALIQVIYTAAIGMLDGAIYLRSRNLWGVILMHTLTDVSAFLRFLYNGIIIKHQKTEPTYTKTSLFLCEKRRFFMARREKGVVPIIYFEKERGKSF